MTEYQSLIEERQIISSAIQDFHKSNNVSKHECITLLLQRANEIDRLLIYENVQDYKKRRRKR
jgi:hypothetical protein